jgi:hypothetical protein
MMSETYPPARRGPASLIRVLRFGCGLLFSVAACAAVWIGVELVIARKQAAGNLLDAAAAAEANLADTLGRVMPVLNGFSAADIADSDPLAVTARLLRQEARLAPGAGLFLFDAAGHFIAGSSPLPEQGGDISAQPWFRATIGDAPAGAPAGERPGFAADARDPLGDSVGVVLYRRLGTPPAGLIGSFLSPAALRGILRPALLSPAATLEVSEAGAAAPLLRDPPTAPASDSAPSIEAAWLRAILDRLGVTTVVAVEQDIAPTAIAPIRWRASRDYLSGLSAADHAAILRRGGIAAGAAGAMVLLFLLLLRPMRRPPPIRAPDARLGGELVEPPADFDASWFWEIDAKGRLVGVAGNAPEALIQAAGDDFITACGGEPEIDPDWGAFRTALRLGEPIQDLQLVFRFAHAPAQPAVNFRLSGRPVAATGGLWGVAHPPLNEPADAALPAPPHSGGLSLARKSGGIAA